MPKMIDADKLLKWIEESPEAEGFWYDLDSRESFDNLTDAINTGVFDPPTSPRKIKRFK